MALPAVVARRARGLLLTRASPTRVRVLRRAACAAAVYAGPPAEPVDDAELPLTGVRVVDLSRVLAGPWATMLLADQGADVIKVEHPDGGDDTRRWGPPFVNGMSTYFMCANRGKRSVTLDLKSAAGRDAVVALASNADVVVENFMPGTAERLGLGYAALRAVNPGLVYASISGYGQHGPLAASPGYDVAVSAATGLLSITGPAGGGACCKPGVALTDISAGQHVHGAIVAALFRRAARGGGRGAAGGGAHVATSLLEVGLANLANVGSAVLAGGGVAARWGSAHESIVPYQAFADADGAEFVVAALNDRQFRDLARTVGLSGLAVDGRFASNAERVRHRAPLVAALAAALATRPRAEWVAALTAVGVTAAPVLSVADALAQPQVVALGLVRVEAHPATGGAMRATANPVSWGPPAPPAYPAAVPPGAARVDTEAAGGGSAELRYLPVRRPPPRLGEHTAEVMQEVLGWSGAEIAAVLRDATGASTAAGV